MVIIVTINEENLTKKPNGSSTGLVETSIMIIADAVEFIGIYAFVPDQYIFHHI
jgi:hypothetical protein